MKAIIIGTGPSLTDEVVLKCKNSGLKLFGVNNVWKVLDVDVFHACNPEYYQAYWEEGLKYITADKWTWDKLTADRYGINYVEGVWADGLSTTPGKIHYHHGSGPQLINIALHYGVDEMILVGWDMRYPIGGKRHFFGEYPENLQHWPKTGPNGEMTGLIKEMETIKPEDYGIKIVNCTPDSAMRCFPMADLDDCL